MPGIYSKITRHVERQENMIHNEEKHQLIETHMEYIQIVESADKNIKNRYYNCIPYVQKIKLRHGKYI